MSKAKEPHYQPALLEDAPEHHELARSLGTLCWDIWDPEVRPVEARIADFVAAYPPSDPARNLTGFGTRRPDGSVGTPTSAERLQRLLAKEWGAGSLHELAARFGLRFRGGPPMATHTFEPADMKTTARKRNVRLRVLHGGVDVEPGDMDAAKAALLDRQEKERAAQEIRAARRRVSDDLKRRE